MTRSPSQATAAGAGKSPTTTPTSTKRKVKRQRVDKEEEGAVAVRTDMQAPPTNTKMPALADMQHYAHDHADKDEVISICSWNVNSLGAALKKGGRERCVVRWDIGFTLCRCVPSLT